MSKYYIELLKGDEFGVPYKGYWWRVRSHNSQVVLTSEVYTTAAKARQWRRGLR